MGTGFIGTRANWAADLNLLVQIALLTVLVAGLAQAKQRRLKVHHAWMTAIVVINAVFVVAVMNPSFFRLLPSAVSNPGAFENLLPLPHMLVGALAEVMGLYAVLWMRMDLPASMRPRNIKWFMRITFTLWAVALLGGIVLYWVLYV